MELHSVENTTSDISSTPAKKKTARLSSLPTDATSSSRKLKINFDDTRFDSMFAAIQLMKERETDADATELLGKAIEYIPESFWNDFVNQKTLSWQLQQAMDNPEMRAKLMDILNTH